MNPLFCNQSRQDVIRRQINRLHKNLMQQEEIWGVGDAPQGIGLEIIQEIECKMLNLKRVTEGNK